MLKKYIIKKLEYRIFTLLIKSNQHDRHIGLYEKPSLISLFQERQINFMIRLVQKLDCNHSDKIDIL